MSSDSSNDVNGDRGRLQSGYLYALAIVMLIWLSYIGWHHWWRPTLLTSLAAASFFVGSLVGFVFTSYEDESSTIGKVKDWLTGALAGLTIVEFHSLKSLLLVFALTNSARDFALTISVAIVFVVVGFFFMFFGD